MLIRRQIAMQLGGWASCRPKRNQKVAGVESISGKSVPDGRALSSGELAALLNTCEQQPLGIHDAATNSLLYGCGLRRAELVVLNISDYSQE